MQGEWWAKENGIFLWAARGLGRLWGGFAGPPDVPEGLPSASRRPPGAAVCRPRAGVSAGRFCAAKGRHPGGCGPPPARLKAQAGGFCLVFQATGAACLERYSNLPKSFRQNNRPIYFFGKLFGSIFARSFPIRAHALLVSPPASGDCSRDSGSSVRRT